MKESTKMVKRMARESTLKSIVLKSIVLSMNRLFDEDSPENNFFDTVEDVLLGSVAHDEIKNLVKSCVSMCFEHSTDED